MFRKGGETYSYNKIPVSYDERSWDRDNGGKNSTGRHPRYQRWAPCQCSLHRMLTLAQFTENKQVLCWMSCGKKLWSHSMLTDTASMHHLMKWKGQNGIANGSQPLCVVSVSVFEQGKGWACTGHEAFQCDCSIMTGEQIFLFREL